MTVALTQTRNATTTAHSIHTIDFGEGSATRRGPLTTLDLSMSQARGRQAKTTTTANDGGSGKKGVRGSARVAAKDNRVDGSVFDSNGINGWGGGKRKAGELQCRLSFSY